MSTRAYFPWDGSVRATIYFRDEPVYLSGNYSLGHPATLERPADPAVMEIEEARGESGPIDLQGADLERAVSVLWKAVAERMEIRFEDV